MKALLPLILIVFGLFSTSCQREASQPVVTYGGGDTLPGKLLVRFVNTWTNVSTNALDSTVTEYTYDAANKLIKTQVIGDLPIFYLRDAQERLVAIKAPFSNGDTGFTKVFYTNPTSTQVNYTLYGTANAAAKPDSMAFTYSGSHVNSTSYFSLASGTAQLQYYQLWQFDTNNNVTQLQVYMGDSTYNIGYSFNYDSKTNPQYCADDGRLPVEWGYIVSPNNVVKQYNFYTSTTTPDNYITGTFTYNSNNLPVTGSYLNSQGGAVPTTGMYYYYQ